MQGNTKSFSTLLLYLAWSGFLVSLVAPATQEPFLFFPAKHMPVAVMLGVSALAAIGLFGRDGNVILIFVAIACFLSSPVAVKAPRRTFRRALSLPVLAGALLAWVPLAESTAQSPHDQLIPLDAPMWGFYLFAAALTVSSAGWLIALFSAPTVPSALDELGPAAPPAVPWSSADEGASNRRGFPVVVRDDEAKPPSA